MTGESGGAVVLFSAGEIQREIQRLAAEISGSFCDETVVVSVLKGSVPFLADLTRAMTIDPYIDFLGISSYAAGTGRIRLVRDLDIEITGRDVVLVEDIVDTGLTLAYLLDVLTQREPSRLEVCTLLDKRARRIVPAPIHFTGFEIPDEFVIGYGLDYAGRYRNLPLVAVADIEVLRRDPDAYVEALYGAS